jgi:peroxiredoxin
MAAGKPHKLLATGSRAPDFRLQRLDGGEVALRDLTSTGAALLAFFKVTCPVCQLAFPFLERIHAGGGAKGAGGTLVVYGISQHPARDTRDFNREFSITFPALLDTEESGYPVSNAFGISQVPSIFLVEHDGKISRVVEGWSKKDMEWLGGKAGVSVFRRGDSVPESKPG